MWFCKFARLEVWNFATLHVYKLASLQICKFTNLKNLRNYKLIITTLQIASA